MTLATVLPLIFKYFYSDEIVRFSRVSKAFFEAAQHKQTWNQVSFGRSVPTIPFLLQKIELSTSLDLSNLNSITSHDLPLIANKCTRLQHISLPTIQAGDGIITFFRTCTTLTSLDWADCHIGGSIVSLIPTLSNMRNINFRNFSNFTSTIAVLLFIHCTKLQSLNLSGNYRFTFDGAVQEQVTKLTGLKHLNLRSIADGRPYSIKCLSTLTNLETLDISNNSQFILDKDIKLPKLRELKMTKCVNVNWKELCLLKNLKVLILAGVNVVDSDLSILSSQAKQLGELSLAKCDKITDAGLIELAEGCKEIHSLDLTGCAQITDKGVIAIAKNKYLRRLDITSIQTITGACIEALAEFCPYTLFKLDFSDCDNVTEQSASAITKCKGLRILHAPKHLRQLLSLSLIHARIKF